MDDPFNIQEIKATLVLSLDLEQLEDYYNRYGFFRETFSDPHILKLLSEKFKVPFERIQSFEDFIYSVSIHGDMEKVCGGEFRLLTGALYWGGIELFNQVFQDNIKHKLLRSGNDVKMRKAGRLINLVLKADPPSSTIRKLILRYGMIPVISEAIKLQKNKLTEKLMKDLQHNLSVEDHIMILNSAAFGDNVEFIERYLNVIIDDIMSTVLLHAAEGNSKRIIELLDPLPVDYIKLLMGYLKAGNHQKVVESAERIPDDAKVSKEDLYLVIHSDCLQCLSYVEDRWGKFNLKDFILYYEALSPGVERLTKVLWELMTRENSKLWRVVFEVLLYEDDFEGLIRITQRFNPDLLFGESLYYRMTDNDSLNDCYRNWLSLKLDHLVL